MRLEYFFDFSCPYAYLASTQIEALAERAGVRLEHKPMLLGGVFRAVGTPQAMAAGMPPAKARHNFEDMHRWARHWGVPLKMPPRHPMRTVRALRALLALPETVWPAVIGELYRAYWVDSASGGPAFDEPSTIAAALERAGIDAAGRERAAAANDDPEIKQELRRRTEEAIERGIFGAPATIVSGEDGTTELFWGQDRLEMVEAALAAGRVPLAGPRPSPPPAASSASPGTEPSAAPATTEIHFFYDFSSPFSYLGSTQIEGVAARAGARLVWKPFLLGALFKEIGTPDVPMLATSDAKRRHLARDLERWAAWWAVPFRFTSRFPMRTVKALRLALLAEEAIAPLTHALYRALWVEDRDLDDDATLGEILTEVGLDPSLAARTAEPSVKERLFKATAEASERGVFGAPTSIVVAPGQPDQLFWGQDRLELLERAALG
jgi:2-hydroxychromene-2-carboxylate isomerase